MLLLVIAIPLGLIAGLHAGSSLDKLILGVTLIGVSIPAFLIAFTLYNHLEPKLGWMEPGTLIGEPAHPISGYCPLFGSGGGGAPGAPGASGACGGLRDWSRSTCSCRGSRSRSG